MGEVGLEADELRADDARPFVWRVAPPARVSAATDAGPFLTAAIGVLRDAGRLATGNDVVFGERPGPGPSVVLPPADAALLGQVNRALATRGVAWRYAEPGTAGELAAPGGGLPAAVAGVEVTRRYRLVGTDSAAVLATVNGAPGHPGLCAVRGRPGQPHRAR